MVLALRREIEQTFDWPVISFILDLKNRLKCNGPKEDKGRKSQGLYKPHSELSK